MQTPVTGSFIPASAPAPPPSGSTSRALAISLPNPVACGNVGDVLELSVLNNFGSEQGNYVTPTAAQQKEFRAIVAGTLQGLRSGDAPALDRAFRRASHLGYDLSQIEVGGAPYMELRETGSSRGWPTVIFNIHPRTGVVVEAPHPAFDMGTPELAWRAFKAFRADVYIVAGAHRHNRSEPSPDVPTGYNGQAYSISDPTHTRATMFQAAHQGATHDGSRVVQFHGFSASKHHAANPDFPEDLAAVLSDGADDLHTPPGLVACAEALQEAGFKSHVVTFDGPLGGDLGAASNVQHEDMLERGLVGPGRPGEFIHIECDTWLRVGQDREATLNQVVDSLKPVFGYDRA